MKSIGKFFLNVVIYVAIVAGIVWGIPKFLSWKLGTDYPIASITSGSMWPVLKEGDLVFIEKVAKEELAIGDIVVWVNPKGFTIHRVVKLNEDTLVTRGDANFKDDPPVPYNDLVGRTYEILGWPARIPYLGYITVFVAGIQGSRG